MCSLWWFEGYLINIFVRLQSVMLDIDICAMSTCFPSSLCLFSWIGNGHLEWGFGDLLWIVEICKCGDTYKMCFALGKDIDTISGTNLLQVLFKLRIRRFALNFEDCAKMGGHENFIEEFKNSKGYRYNKLSKPYRYLSLR